MKMQTNAEVVIVAMSGNVVQRGEFAIIDKWKRAELAIESGADLVIELPLLASLQAADYFAHYGIQALNYFNVNTFAFGTETAHTNQLQTYVEALIRNQEQIDEVIPNLISQGFSYAAAIQLATEEFMEETFIDFNPSLSNHILAIQYLLHNKKLNKPMQVLAIPRLKENDDNRLLLSGSQIRSKWFNQTLKRNDLPKMTYDALLSSPTIKWDDYWSFLKYAVLSKTKLELNQIFHMREGFENRLIKQIKQSESIDDLIRSLTSKRWTTSSIQRVLMAILLNISKEEWESYQKAFQNQPFYRILGFNDHGQQYLNYLKQNKVNFHTKIYNHKSEAYFGNLRADLVYALNPNHQVREQNYQTLLYIKK